MPRSSVEIQRAEFKRLGVLGDWEQSLPDDGLEVRGEVRRSRACSRRATSCIAARSRCTGASLQDRARGGRGRVRGRTVPSVYVRFAVAGLEARELRRRPTQRPRSIWTTTPWTLPANLAVALQSRARLPVAVEVGADTYIVAKGLLESVSTASGGATLPGRDLTGASSSAKGTTGEGRASSSTRSPTRGRTRRARPRPARDARRRHRRGPHGARPRRGRLLRRAEVRASAVQPGGRRRGVPPRDGRRRLAPGRLRPRGERGDREGPRGPRAPPRARALPHTYPHCWRCRNPVLFRSTPQWFISMDAATFEARPSARSARPGGSPRSAKRGSRR